MGTGRGRAQHHAARLVREHARDIQEEDLGLALSLYRLFLQGTDAGLELDVDEGTTLENEHGDEQGGEHSHGRSIPCGRGVPR